MSRIPATVITGFLGAGKTSLIRHLLAHAGGRRIALLINEFGDLGVDRDVLLGCGIEGCGEGDIVELANGCICCTVADEFLPAMTGLLAREPAPQHIIIETSGLALPKPLIKAFTWPEVRSRVTVDGVVAVIDAPAAAAGRFADDPVALEAARRADPSLDHESPLAELFADQIQAADLVVLNKRDLVNGAAGAAEGAQAAVAPYLRRGVKTVTAAHGRLDPAIILGIGAAAEADLAARPSCHDGEPDHDHDDFASVVVTIPALADPTVLAAAMARLAAAHPVYRVKGVVEVVGKPMRLVIQAVGARVERYYDRPWAAGEERASRLVVIGARGMDFAGVARALGGAVR